MYGKIDPGARQPYRTIRSKGIQPGCKYKELIIDCYKSLNEFLLILYIKFEILSRFNN